MSTPWVERSSRVSSALPDDTKTLEPLSNSHYGRIAVPIRGAATRGAQGDEGAPDAWLDLDAQYREGLRDLKAGAEILARSRSPRCGRFSCVSRDIERLLHRPPATFAEFSDGRPDAFQHGDAMRLENPQELGLTVRIPPRAADLDLHRRRRASYPSRSTAAGSSRAARRAGSQAARTPAATSTPAAPANAAGSRAST